MSRPPRKRQRGPRRSGEGRCGAEAEPGSVMTQLQIVAHVSHGCRTQAHCGIDSARLHEALVSPVLFGSIAARNKAEGLTTSSGGGLWAFLARRMAWAIPSGTLGRRSMCHSMRLCVPQLNGAPPNTKPGLTVYGTTTVRCARPWPSNIHLTKELKRMERINATLRLRRKFAPCELQHASVLPKPDDSGGTSCSRGNSHEPKPHGTNRKARF